MRNSGTRTVTGHGELLCAILPAKRLLAHRHSIVLAKSLSKDSGEFGRRLKHPYRAAITHKHLCGPRTTISASVDDQRVARHRETSVQQLIFPRSVEVTENTGNSVMAPLLDPENSVAYAREDVH